MGFMDRFTRTLDDVEFRWSDAGRRLGEVGTNLRDLFLEGVAIQTNLVFTPFGGKAKENREAYWATKSLTNRLFDQAGRGGAVVGGVFGAVGEALPPARVGFGAADALQHELVGRPVATANLVRADAVNQRNLGTIFEGETWNEAYNTTSYVTPGQAMTFAALSNVQDVFEMLGVAELDAQQRKRLIEEHPVIGLLAQDPEAFDPRIRGEDGGRRAYYDNNLMKGLSGTLDTGIVLFADPTVGLSKLAGLAKARYISNEMSAAALQSGRLEGHISSRSYRGAKDFIQQAENSEVVRRRMFNNHYDGDLASALLFDAAKAQGEYSSRGGTVDLYDTTFRALYGDVNAWRTITQEAPRIADVVGHERAVYTIAQAAKNYGLGDNAVNARVNKLMESKNQAWVDATVNGHGLWGKASEGLLVDQAVPRLRATSAWRVGAHSFVRNKVPVILGNWHGARRGQFLLPSQRSGRMLDLNDVNSAGTFRSVHSLSRLTQEELDRWVGAYARATSSEGRFVVYNAAENYILAKSLKPYGISFDEFNNKVLPLVNKFRRGNRQVLAANRRFASDDVRKKYEERLTQSPRRLKSANELAALKKGIDDAVERGEFPDHYYTLPDEHGNLTLVPEDRNVRLDQPILATQHADVVPMIDWNVLENALWWHLGFGRGKPGVLAGDRPAWAATTGRAIYGAQEMTRATLEAVMSTWKVTAILRPGYVPRTLSDEVGRIWAKQGAFSSMATMGRSSGNIAANMRSRGRLVGEIIGTKRARGTRVEVDAPVVASGVAGRRLTADPADPTTPAALGDGDLNYSSIEEWFADGGIGVDDYLGRVEAHGNAGTLNGPLAEIYDAYRAGTKSAREFRRHAVDYALRATDRGAYISPAWQRSLLNMVERAFQRKQPGKPGKEVVVDPLSGESPDLTRDQIDKFFTRTKSHHIQVDEFGYYNVDDVYDFIADNIDELMLPDRLLGAYRTPDGRVSLGIGYSTHPKAPKEKAVKPTAGVRVKLPWNAREGDLLRDSGYADLMLNTPVGRITVQGSFMGGDGDRFRHQVSSRGPEDAWVDAVTDTNFARWVEKSQRWVDVGPDDWRAYKTSWERAVNLHLGQDKMAQQFLQGKSYNDVISWLFNTSEGRAYHFKMGPWRSQYAEQATMVQSMVDVYLPITEKEGESLALRQKAMAQKATIEDFEQIKPRGDMPKVHGATIEMGTGRGPIMDSIKRGTDKAFKVLSDLPNDKLARFPFANERYNLHVRNIAQARGVQKAAANDTFTPADVDSIKRMAHRRALRDVQRYLYHTNATWDFAKAMRLIIPFGSAIADSNLKWGLVLRENPAAGIQLWKLYNAPERAGLVSDQDGNQLEIEEGEEVWYQVNPKTGQRTRLEDHKPDQRFIAFQLPTFVSERFYGGDVKPHVRISKRGLQTFLDVPTAGPIVALPANKFALENPEFADNAFIKQWILPLGPSANASNAVIPANVRNLRQVVFPTWAEQDRQTAEAQAIGIFASEMTAHSLGQRPNPPTFEEARDKAAAMRGLRFWSAFGAGVSPQIQTPYQPYVDYYRQLRVREAELRRKAADEGRDQAEVPAADEQFYDEMGPEFFALTARVTRNALGIPATIGSHKAYKKYQDLIDKHPDIASLIIGAEGAGEFNRAVYEGQKLLELRPGSGRKQRERLSMEESWEDMQKRRGWLEYSRQQDLWTNQMIRLGVTSLEQLGAEQLKGERDQWLNDRMFVNSPWGETVLNPWFEDFRSVDTSRTIGRLHSLRQIVQDPRLQGRDDIRGLIEYLELRDRFIGHMDRTGIGSLAGEEQEGLRASWQRMVFGLRESNPSFSALHDRWLTGDENLEARA